jgi:hypothetical protein
MHLRQIKPSSILPYKKPALNRCQLLEPFSLSEMVKWGEFKYRRDNEIMRITV